MRYLVLAAALAACTGKSDRADTADVALPAIDTIKPVTTSDTAATAVDTVRPAPTGTKAPGPTTGTRTPAARTQTSGKLGRDSAFPPPANLPRLDTVKKKPTR